MLPNIHCLAFYLIHLYFFFSIPINAIVVFIQDTMHVLWLAWLYFIASRETSTCPSKKFFFYFFFFISNIVSHNIRSRSRGIYMKNRRKKKFFFRWNIQALRVTLQQKRQTLIVTKTCLNWSGGNIKKEISQLK